MKKIRIFALFLAVLMLAGCSAAAAEQKELPPVQTETPPSAVENIAVISIAPETVPPQTVPAETVPPATVPVETAVKELTREEAEAIALEHAGFAADQVLHLRSELDYDNGHKEYDVEFQVDRWEYDYEIHAETGKILSWDKDWDD